MFYYGLACLACVIVVNAARTVGQNQSVQDADTAVVDSAAPLVPHESVPFAHRIPSVDPSPLTYPVQPARFDSVPWNSSVEPSQQVQPTHDAAQEPEVSIPSLPSFESTANVVPPQPNQPERKQESTSFERSPSINHSNAPEPKVILNQTESGAQHVFNNPFVDSNSNSQFDPEPTASLPADPPISNRGVHQPKRISGVYPLADALNEPADAPTALTKQPAKIANRYFSSQLETMAAVAPETASPIQSNLTAPLETANETESAPIEFASVTGFEEPDHDMAIEVQPNNNDFVPHLASLPQPNATNVLPSTAPTTGAAQEDVPSVLQGAEKFVLAEQPKPGDHWNDDRPITDQRAWLVDPIKDDFSPDPINSTLGYDPNGQMQVYEGKSLNANQRPLVELGRPWYQLGQLSPGYSWFGKHNNIVPQFLVYGDVRTAAASNSQNGDSSTQLAFEANLDFDLKLTGTERFHMFMSPLDDGQNTRWLLDEDRFVDKLDADIDFGYFEGDLGAMVGGFTNQTLPFDLPFAVGVMPLLLQNGVWMEDAFLGVATTIPARSSRRFNISNMDTTFFAGYDKINSDAFANDDSAARMYGMATFIEAMNGYFEIDYAFLDDRTIDDRSYHNIGFGYSRRFGRLLSNSTRVIVNTGQSTDVVENSADGVLLLSENSLITRSPSTLVPYMNFFAGFDRPQSAARAAAAGGVLRNTGILFESDGMTNYPTLDPTANDTYGGALGLNLIADDFSQQLVVEMAMLGVMGDDANRNVPGSQYGVGFRYQLPLTNAVILRADGMYGFLEDDHDVHGVRLELRHKY